MESPVRQASPVPPAALVSLAGRFTVVMAAFGAVRRAYVPVLLVYFAYGALGVIDVSRDMWVKESLHLSPAELAGIAIWLSLPWTVKMVFGQLVDSVPILGSQRRAYIFIGAALCAAGMVTLAGAAGGWFGFAAPASLYVLGALLIVLGAVVQDVVADAMTAEVVERMNPDGSPRPAELVRTELAMVQLLGRMALGLGVLSVAGLSGWLAHFLARETVFLIGLVVPACTVVGVMLVRTEAHECHPIDWRILGGGMGFGAAVAAIGLGGVPYGQELIFVLSMAVIGRMLFLVTREMEQATRRAILYGSIIIFAFRATPSVGDGAFWWTLDELHFDEGFYGTLRQTSAVIGLVAMWLLRRRLTESSVHGVLLLLAVVGAVLALPNIALFYGVHHWTQEAFGFGARTIALLDTAAAGPFEMLSMIPLLTLIAVYAPKGNRATWFALMASLMNMALVAGQLQTKYLNHIFVVRRGDYSELGALMLVVTAIGLILPVGAIALCRGR